MFAANPGWDFLDTFDLGVLFVGIAVFAAVGALSHQRERAFSASLIYLGLGAGAAVAIGALDIGWIDPIDDAQLLEHLAEAALVMALFSAGLKLDRALTFRDWATVARLLGLAMPVTIGLVRARLDRRARPHRGAVAAAAAGQAASSSTAGDAARPPMRSSTAASSAGWWIGSSPGSSLAATRSSAGRIVSPAA